MVYGQHRLPSHSSPEPAGAELSLAAVPRGRSGLQGHQAGDLAQQFQGTDLSALGRATQRLRWILRPARTRYKWLDASRFRPKRRETTFKAAACGAYPEDTAPPHARRGRL